MVLFGCRWKTKKDLDTGGSNGNRVVPSISHESDPEKMDAYEPFYISSGTISAINERFLDYRFNRSSQVKEMTLGLMMFSN
jgi:hypothetical protein